MIHAAAARPAVELRATVITEREQLRAHTADWDALAEACSRPFCAAGWLLAWWDHARPAQARLGVVLVHDAAELVGVAPGFCDRGTAGVVRWRPLAAQTCQRVEPFAAPGREHEVAAAVARALHGMQPRPQVLSFEGAPGRSPWPGLLRDAWPGRRRPRSLKTGSASALVLDLAGADYEAWLASKTAHFRQRLHKSRRTTAKSGGSFRLADAESAAADIESFLRLHVGRWEQRGGTRAVPPPVAAMLRDAGPGLVASGQLRIWSLDLAGTTIASSLVFRAGAEVGYWLNGFDATHAKLEPSKVSILHVVEDAFALGAARLDLGEGAYAYKQRFADEEEELVRICVIPMSPRAPQVAVGLAPTLARSFAAAHLSEDRKARLRGLLERRGRRP